MVLAAIFLLFLRLCAVPRNTTIILTILAAWLYAGVTGWQEPVLRSATGMTLFGIGRCFYREGRLLNILAAIAILFLVADPDQLFDAGFQLSFMAVAADRRVCRAGAECNFQSAGAGAGRISTTSRKISGCPAKSAQFRVEMRLLARTLELVARFQAWAARVTVVAVARCCMFIWDMFVTSFFLQLGFGAPDDRLFPSDIHLGNDGERDHRAAARGGGAAGVPCDRAEFADTRACVLVVVECVRASPSACMRAGSRSGGSPRHPTGWRLCSSRR